jgi:hypothetical protein
VGSDPEELAATLRELARLDPVELGLQAVLERIVQAAATRSEAPADRTSPSQLTTGPTGSPKR